jgi:hypothetical protein
MIMMMMIVTMIMISGDHLRNEIFGKKTVFYINKRTNTERSLNKPERTQESK